MKLPTFARRLIDWQRCHGRHDLPWQRADAYRVWLSEIMLQQTQVATVIPYYRRFIESFPTITDLAAASEDEVLAHWSGLGYYARGRNLHRAARLVVEKHAGVFPRDFERILELPGIGRSTAAAICALAYHEHRAILDGNVKRVLARHCGIEGWPGERKVEDRLWQQAEAMLPRSDVAAYTQGLMDLGATVCTRSRPKCAACPLQADCAAMLTERTAELPTPRPRKSLPEKHATLLLLRHGNDILLEKRPGNGIWGGLWTLPQLDNGKVANDYLQGNGMTEQKRTELPPFTHTFTHFRLCITPLLLHIHEKPTRAMQPGSMWMDAESALEAAIPAPVRKLLQSL